MLTIAIPTFQRAHRLDRQLAWLSAAVQGHEDLVELVVSDNCSSDETPDVAMRWQQALGDDLLQVRRQPENIGAIRNIRDCLVRARNRHVWVVGDDDEISPSAVAEVLGRLRRHPDLALLNLNFSSTSAVTGELIFSKCYGIERERVRADGAAAVTELLAKNYGGVALTTAQVYRADLVRQAVDAWGRQDQDNLLVQVYWTAWCAAHGDVMTTADTLLDCSAGTHFFVADPVLHLRLGTRDMPELARRLRELGYPRTVLDQLVLEQLSRHQAGVALRALRQDPLGTAAAGAAYLRALHGVGWAPAAAQLRKELPRPFWRRAAAKALRSIRRDVRADPATLGRTAVER